MGRRRRRLLVRRRRLVLRARQRHRGYQWGQRRSGHQLHRCSRNNDDRRPYHDGHLIEWHTRSGGNRPRCVPVAHGGWWAHCWWFSPTRSELTAATQEGDVHYLTASEGVKQPTQFANSVYSRLQTPLRHKLATPSQTAGLGWSHANEGSEDAPSGLLTLLGCSETP